MKLIEKDAEPEGFAAWKRQGNADWQPTYDDLRDRPRDQLHFSLMREQGFICCYCGEKIGSLTSNIEHLKPRQRFPDLELDYGNLLASCLGGQGEAHRKQLHCNPAKGDWYSADLMVSPLERDCEAHFVFSLDGQVLPTKNPNKRAAAEETIKRLNLNSDRLVRRRFNALIGVFMAPRADTGGWTLPNARNFSEEALSDIIAQSTRRDDEESFRPFCSAILSVAEQKLLALRDAASLQVQE